MSLQPNGVVAVESIVDSYKPSIDQNLRSDDFGGLRWDSVQDSQAGHRYDSDETPNPAELLNLEIDRVLDAESEQDLPRSVAYNMGIALGAVAQERTASKSADPDVEALTDQLFDAADSKARGYHSKGINNLGDLMDQYAQRGGILRDDAVVAATYFEEIMDEV